MHAPAISPLVLFVASIFTSNILLANFLGMCSFITISRDLNSSNGLGLAVTLVMVITAVLNWYVIQFILIPMDLMYLRYIVYIIIIAATVQVLEMFIDRVSPALYMALGIFLPLITVNCAIMGVILFMDIRQYTLWQSIAFSFGSGLGWWLAIILLASIQKRLATAPIPVSLKGAGITLITIGFMAMGFIGFSGMIAVQ